MNTLPHATHLTEFVPKSTGGLYTGTCGQTALAEALGISQGYDANINNIVLLAESMAKKGRLTADNGAATLQALAAEARDQRGKVVLELDYDDPRMIHWRGYALQYGATHPIVWQVNNGRALKDALTGVSDESDLHCHAIASVGADFGGSVVICNDGDHPQVKDRFQTYTLDTIAAAEPCAMLVLAPPSVPAPPVKPTTSPAMKPSKPALVNIPAGWSDDSTTLWGPPIHAMGDQRFPVINGFRQALIAHNELFSYLGEPIEAEHGVNDVGADGIHGAGVRQVFTRGALGWTPKENVFQLWTGLLWKRSYGAK